MARCKLLGISPEQVRCERRGFERAEDAARVQLERIGCSFVHGYHSALRAEHPHVLGDALEPVAPELRGFAHEGAGMGMAVLDALTPWKANCFRVYLEGAGRDHPYMLHVGAGWAMARLRWRLEARLRGLDPLLRWLALDGFGFHEGYFRWPHTVDRQQVTVPLGGYARRAYDQGLGRSLWFVRGANPARIGATVAAFVPARRADLWSGVGLAAAYAGIVPRAALERLRAASGEHVGHLAQGAAFAAKCRERAGNPAPHTALACDVLCGASAVAAAAVTDRALATLPAVKPCDGAVETPVYELWRQRTRRDLGAERSG